MDATYLQASAVAAAATVAVGAGDDRSFMCSQGSSCHCGKRPRARAARAARRQRRCPRAS
eukprot:scaffold182_cov350-Prasinococcus_capsulatus_cf.AAC.19